MGGINLSGLNAFGQALGNIITNNPTQVSAIITAAQSAFGDPNVGTEVNELKKAGALFAAGHGDLAVAAIKKATDLMTTQEMVIEEGLMSITAATKPLDAIQEIQIAINALQGK